MSRLSRLHRRRSVQTPEPSERPSGAPMIGSGAPASSSDIAIAYRLLLGREPDLAGQDHYSSRIAAGLSLAELAEEVINSPEFARRHRDVGRYRPDTAIVDVQGFSIIVEPSDWAVGRTIASERDYEPEVSASVRALLDPSCVFVDVGANIGWYSLLAASLVGNSGRVLAIEPNLRNVALLNASRELNGFTAIEVFAGAAYDDEVWLALDTDASNGTVIPLGPVTGSAESVACSYVAPGATLDRLLDDRGLFDSVGLVKVDVEGSETRVLRGAAKLLDEVHPPIVFEWYPDALRKAGGVSPEAPLDLLREHGYSISAIGYRDRDSDGARDLSNSDIERLLASSGRDLLDLLARVPTPSGQD